MSIIFGKFQIPDEEIVWKGQYSYVIVNLKPIVPNHLLVIPYRKIKTFNLLNTGQLEEMMRITALISKQLREGVSSVAIQDGLEAGQSVQHVHIHIVPRVVGARLQVNPNHPERTLEEMGEEAQDLRQQLAFE